MAYVAKLPSGRYRGLYYLPNGQRRSAGTFDKHKAAKDAAIEAEGKVKRPDWRDPNAGLLTWGTWCERWWPTRGIEPSTARNEASMVEHHLAPHWRDVPLASITRVDVQGWATALVAENIGEPDEPRYRGAGSVRRYLNILVSSLTAAVDAKLIDANPAVRIKLPPPPEGNQVYLTRSQYDALRQAVPLARDRAVLDFLAGTGLRWGELAGLHLHNLDLRDGYVTVRDVLDADAREVKAYPKGRRSRDVPVLQWAVDELELPEAHGCGLPHRDRRKCASGLVFEAPEGGALDDRNFYRRVLMPALKAAGLDGLGFTLHDFRHTYASWLAQDGVSLGRIADLLGHRSVVTTEIYAHFGRAAASDIEHAMRDPRGANVVHDATKPRLMALRRHG